MEHLRHEQRKLQRKADNLLDFVADGDTSPAIRDRLRETETRLNSVYAQLLRAEALRRDPVLVTPHAVRDRLCELGKLLRQDPTRARGVLRSLFPERVAVVVEGKTVRVRGELRYDAEGATVSRAFEVAVV